MARVDGLGIQYCDKPRLLPYDITGQFTLDYLTKYRWHGEFYLQFFPHSQVYCPPQELGNAERVNFETFPAASCDLRVARPKTLLPSFIPFMFLMSKNQTKKE